MLNGKVVTQLVYSCDVTRDDGKVFRIEVHQHEDDAEIHVVERALKVYRLSYPEGVMHAPVKGVFPKFRQYWMYLEDFPKVSMEGFPNNIRDRAIEQILKLN